MSYHKRIFDRAFNRHHHLNRAAAAAGDDDPRAAEESAAAAAASSRAAALAAAVAASKSADAAAKAASETIPATFTTPLTLPGGQVLPVPHGPTPEVNGVTTESTPPAVHQAPSSVVSVSHTPSTSVAVTAAPTSTVPSLAISSQKSSSTPAPVSSSKGLSSGAIGALVTILVLLFVIIGTVVVRKFYMRRRAMKRNTWGAGLVPALENKRSTVYDNQSTIVSEPKSSVVSQTTATSTSIPTPTSASLPTPPSLSYTPSAPTSISPLVPPIANATNAGVSSSSMPAAATEFAVVVRTFVPTLPDELHISNGEHIRVISSFDDGWALCSNVRGEQGVVPLECLHRETFSTQMQLQPESEFGYDSNKAARRLSSLVPSIGATY